MPPRPEPAGGGREFAILLRVPVLGTELGLAVAERARGTRRTVDRARAVVFGAIQGDQAASIGLAMGVQGTLLVQGVDRVEERRGQTLGGDRIEQVADLLGARNRMPAKQRTGLVASALFTACAADRPRTKDAA